MKEIRRKLSIGPTIEGYSMPHDVGELVMVTWNSKLPLEDVLNGKEAWFNIFIEDYNNGQRIRLITW